MLFILVADVMGCVVEASHSSTAAANGMEPGRVIIEDTQGTVSVTFVHYVLSVYG